MSLTPAASGAPGHFDVEYRFTVAATGDKSLTLLSMTDDMTQADQLGVAFVDVVSPAVVVNLNASRPPEANPNYNGTNKLLNSSENDLVEPGQGFEIRVTVEINPDAPGAPDPLQNQGFASAFNTEGGFERDITDSGSNPGGTNPGEPGDTGGSDDPTPLDFGSIGLAKEVVAIVEASSGTSGNFDVTYSFVTQNTGDFSLSQLSLVDNMRAPDQLGAAFVDVVSPGPSVVNIDATSPPVPNPGYNGTGDLLNGSANDELEPGQSFRVLVTIEIDPGAPGAPADLVNQGEVTGETPAGNIVKDLSDSGADPDSDNPGAPGDTGGSDDPTPVEFPGIGVAKEVARLRDASSGTPGNFDIGYLITVRNTGTTDLSDLSLIDNMTEPDSLGTAFVRIALGPLVRNQDATRPPAPNQGYNGSGDLLNGSPADLLAPGESFQVGVIVEVNPGAQGAPNILLNQAIGSGIDENDVVVSDPSDSGNDPDGTNPGEPGDTGGSDDPTPVAFPGIGAAKFVSNTFPNGSNTDIEFTVVVENTGTTTLSNLTLLDLMSDPSRLGTAFVGVSSAPVVVNVDASVPPLPNPGFNGDTNIDLINGSPSDQLRPGQSYQVVVVVTVNPAAPGAPNPLLNQVLAGGIDGQGTEVSDTSDSGADPDGTNPGAPGDTGGPDDPTPIPLPQIGVAKEVAAVADAQSGIVGNVDVTYSFVVGNTGTTNLSQLSLVDNMTAADQLGSAFVRVSASPTVVNISANEPPAPNPGYNGTGDLLAGDASDDLASVQRFQVLVTIEVDGDAMGAPDELFNQGLASGTDPSGITVTDISDTGSNPNTDNPGAPGDNGTSDDPTPLELPQVGLAKEVATVSDAQSGISGNVDVVYSFVFANTGTTDLSQLALLDNMSAADQLGSAFVRVVPNGPSVVNIDATRPPAPNGSYNGTGDLLSGSPNDLLESGQSFQVLVTIEVDSDAPGAPAELFNQGLAQGTDPSGLTVSDPSDTGSDPTGNNPGAPGDNGTSDDPTPLALPNIGLAKEVSVVANAASGVAGNFDVSYTFAVENTGTTTLSNLSLIDDLTAADQLGSAFVAVLAAPEVVNLDATNPPNGNPGYNGTNDLLLGSPGDVLEAGQRFQVRLRIEVSPNAPGAPDDLVNQGEISGTDENGTNVSDLSDTGSDPNGTNPGEPGDSGGSDDPTPIAFPDIGAAKFVSGIRANGTNTDIEYTLVVENTGDTQLSQLSLLDPMSDAGQLGSAFVEVRVAPVVNNIDANVPPAPNPGFDGVNNIDLLAGSAADRLAPGQAFEVVVVVTVDPSVPGAPNPLLNQAIAGGTDGQGLEVSDPTDSGADPDGTNPGEPGDTGGSDDPTPVVLPQIGLAKEVADVEDASSGIAGNVDVTYSFVMANTGSTDLSSLALLDDMSAADELGTAFVRVVPAGPSVVNIDATSPPAPNGSYNGTGDLLSGSPNDLLEPGQSFQVLVTVEVDADAQGAPAELFNQGLAQGTDPSGLVVEDPSDTGSDPNGTNPGAPGDNGTSDDPTPLELPNVGLAKRVTSVADAASGTAGNFDVGYTFVVENTGITDLSNLSLIDDMTAADQLGSAFIEVITAPAVINGDATSPPNANPGYDGTNDLLNGSPANLLEPGQTFEVTVTIEVSPDAAGAPADLVNQGVVSGVDPNGTEVSDPSDTGADPDGTNPGEPGDSGGSDDPTPISFPGIGVAKSISQVTENGSNLDVEYTMVVENTGDTTLSLLTLLDPMTDDDLLGSAFVAVSVAPVVNNIDATVPPAPNPGFDGTNDLIAGSGADRFAPGQRYEVVVVVEVDASAPGAPSPLLNQVEAGGTDSQGLEVSDLSDSGLDPDGDNPGAPGDTGGSDDPTPLDVPAIGLAKEVAQVVDAQSGIDGNVDVTYSFIVGNTGTTDLSDLSLVDDMTAADQLGTAFVRVVPGGPTVVNIDATSAPDPNSGYDGTGDLLDGSSSDLLELGQTFQVLVTIEVDGDAVGAPAELFNQGLAAGTDPSGITVTDPSDTGSDPNGTNPGEPGDNGTSDDPTPLKLPNIGLAKTVTGVDLASSGVAGNFDVGYTFVVENTGNATLSNLSLIDDMTAADQLGSAFAGVVAAPAVVNLTATNPPQPNPGYNGTNDLLLGSPADVLEPGQRFQVTVIVEVAPDQQGAPEDLVNQGVVSGTDENGTQVDDPSDTGTDPNGTNPGEPGDSGGSDDPTPISFPKIGVSKNTVSVIPNGDNFDTVFSIIVENTGDNPLSQLSLIDDMTMPNLLGTAFVEVSVAPVVINIDASTPPAPNPAYDGTNDLLIGSANDLLEPGQRFEVQVTVEIDPSAANAPDPLLNQALAAGTDPQGLEVTDLSDSGLDPDGTNPGAPGDTGGADDPTPIEFAQIGVSKAVDEIVANGSNFDVTYRVIVTNSGVPPLTNLTLLDDMTASDRLGSAFVGITESPVVVNVDATRPPAPNSDYDGTDDLISGGPTDLLESGQTYEVFVTVEVDPDADLAPESLFNQVTATGEDPNGLEVTDDSDSGTDPDGSNPGEPGDTGGSDDPTPTQFPDLQATKDDELLIDADGDGVVSSGDTLRYTVVVENVGDDEAEDVVFDDSPDANTTLVVGSVVVAPIGTVVVGNEPGDTTVQVDLDTVPADALVTIAFDVTVNDELIVPPGRGKVLLSEQLDPTTLYEVDLETGVATFILDFVTDPQVHAVGLCSDVNLLYGIAKGTAEVLLVDLSDKPPVEIAIGALPAEYMNQVVQATCGLTSDELLFTNAGTNELVTINPTTCPSCDPTIIGTIETALGLGDIEVNGADIAFLPDGRLFLLTNFERGLYEVDPETALATFVGMVETTEDNHGLAATADGRLVVASNDDFIYDIDIETGATIDTAQVTLDGEVLDLGFGDAAAAPNLPEPLANQGVVTSPLLGEIVTDDPTTPELDDPTLTPIGGCPVMSVVQTDMLALDSDDSGDVSAGDVIEYTAQVISRGTLPEDSVLFQSQFEEGLALVPGSVRVDRGEVLLGQEDEDTAVGVFLGSLAPGESAEISFSALVGHVSGSRTIAHQSEAFSEHSQLGMLSDDPRTPFKGDPTTTTMRNRGRLESWNTVRLLMDNDRDGLVSAGDIVRQTITVENYGIKAIENVEVADMPADGSSLIPGSVTTNGGDVAYGNYDGDDRVHLSIPRLTGGNAVTFSFNLIVDEGATWLIRQGQVRAPGHGKFLTDNPLTIELDDANALRCFE